MHFRVILGFRRSAPIAIIVASSSSIGAVPTPPPGGLSSFRGLPRRARCLCRPACPPAHHRAAPLFSTLVSSLRRSVRDKPRSSSRAGRSRLLLVPMITAVDALIKFVTRTSLFLALHRSQLRFERRFFAVRVTRFSRSAWSDELGF